MAIEVKNLFYTYNPKTPNKHEALFDVSLNIPTGSFTGIIGKTGSGKSTLIQTLNALLLPTSGKVILDDFVITNEKKKNKHLHEIRKHLGVVFQFPEYQLFEETVEKDVAFGPKNFGVKPEDALKKAHEALLAVGLNESYFTKSPFALSGGEKRKVAIAGILAIEPEILVLDEPTAGLDDHSTKELLNLICEMHKNGKTIIIVTHDMNIVTEYCDQVFAFNDGKIVYSGTPNSLFSHPELDLGIEVPPLYKLINALKERGAPIDRNSIHSSDDLIKQIQKWRNSHE